MQRRHEADGERSSGRENALRGERKVGQVEGQGHEEVPMNGRCVSQGTGYNVKCVYTVVAPSPVSNAPPSRHQVATKSLPATQTCNLHRATAPDIAVMYFRGLQRQVGWLDSRTYLGRLPACCSVTWSR